MSGPRIGGEDHGGPVLTVRQLKDFIAKCESSGQNLDENFVHIMRMDDDRGDDDSGYATGVELDICDTTTGDEDGDPIHVLQLLRWPSRDWPGWKEEHPIQPSADTLTERARCRRIVERIFGRDWHGNDALAEIDRGGL